MAADSWPVIDTHIHLFDTRRAGGVPWPPADNKILYQPALPDRYRKLAVPLGVVGAIEVEASPLLEDNQWVLDIAAKDKIIVGTVGSLDPGSSDFSRQLDRFHANPLFLGIRYGNLWGRDPRAISQAPFIAGAKKLAAAGLSLDSANPTPELIRELLHLSDRVPELRIIIDHLPQMQPPAEAKAKTSYQSDLREFAHRTQVFVKISEVLRRVDGRVPLELSVYRARLDEISGVFGEDRVLFGSDWPNSDTWADYATGFKLVREYFTGKGRAAAEKYFWRNSARAYRWVKRDGSQPSA
jgi:predicted TIM-barrel fold metal-dependent hydrolase